jgi:anti-anti-sigma factor
MREQTRESLSVQWVEEGGTVLVIPRGDAGFRQAEVLRDALARVAALRPRRVVLNLSRLDFISSAGMGVLVSFKRALSRGGAGLTLAAVAPPVFDALRVAGLVGRPAHEAARMPTAAVPSHPFLDVI